MTATAFPLAWPFGLPRHSGGRASSTFKTALDPALKNVANSLRRFGEATSKPVQHLVISSNYTLGDRAPKDPGVAVWFLWDGQERCIAVDRYQKLEHNLQAIHHVLEARITEARHGGLRIVQQTFTGFVALLAPADIGGRTPAQILGLDGRSFGRDDIVTAHRELAKKLHPDRSSGDGQAMADLNAARDALLSGMPA